MSKVLSVLLLAFLLPATALASQKAKPSPKPKTTLGHRVDQARQDLVIASEEYKASLEKVLPFEEQERKSAAEEVKRRKQMLAEGTGANERDVMAAERRLASAEAKLKSTRQQLIDADQLIEEAINPPPIAPTARPKRRVTPSKPRKPAQKQKLPPYIKIAKSSGDRFTLRSA